MTESSQFTNQQLADGGFERLECQGATSETSCVKLYGKLHFVKRLKAEHVNDVRYQEAFQKEFETGYRLEHQGLPRYISKTDDGILMEYVDGETLTERMTRNPSYFSQKNTKKFILQLLDVVSYLHAHQVLHLDLKPDNILLTRIDSDVKLIDLGCCYTDTFIDTQGHTKGYAAPEQLHGGVTDERTDIYAIGKILEQIPGSQIYNKVIARCTADNPAERYQTVGQLQKDLSSPKRPYLILLLLIILMVLVAVVFYPSSRPVQPAEAPKVVDTIVRVIREQPAEAPVRQESEHPVSPTPQKSEPVSMEPEMDKQMDEAYQATIATFCDSVFPPQAPSSGKAWADATMSFHNQTLQIANRLIKKYPNIPESTIRQDCESRFQHLVASVFNQMRQNGSKTSE